MSVLEVLFWMALGAFVAMARLGLGQWPRPTARVSAMNLVLCAAAAVVGGVVGLYVMRPPPDLGDFNVASIVLAATAAALALLGHTAIDEHRADRPSRII